MTRTERKLALIAKLSEQMVRHQRRWAMLEKRKARVTKLLWNDKKAHHVFRR